MRENRVHSNLALSSCVNGKECIPLISEKARYIALCTHQCLQNTHTHTFQTRTHNRRAMKAIRGYSVCVHYGVGVCVVRYEKSCWTSGTISR